MVSGIAIFIFSRAKSPQDNFVTHLLEQRTFKRFQRETMSDTNNINSKTKPEDPWKVWVNKQVEMDIKLIMEESKYPPEGEEINELRKELRLQLFAQLPDMKKEFSTPPPVSIGTLREKRVGVKTHSGPQTVEALMASFDEDYNHERPHTEADEKYPQAEWLQMLLDRGVTIQDYGDYSGLLNLRGNLVSLEKDQSRWASEFVPETDNWETFKDAYIDLKIEQVGQLGEARRADPNITGGFFLRNGTFLPSKPKRVYVERFEMGASFLGSRLTEEQKFDITHRGIQPEGYEVIYIDGEGNQLDEPPAPMSLEEMLENATPPPPGWIPPEGWTPPPGLEEALQAKGWTGSFSPQGLSDSPQNTLSERAEAAAQAANEQVASAQQRLIEQVTKTDAEIEAELEKLLTPDIPDDVDMENALREKFEATQFTPERFEKALDLLMQYGTVEGVRRLQQTDPAISTEIQKWLSQDAPPRKDSEHSSPPQRKPSFKPPQELPDIDED